MQAYTELQKRLAGYRLTTAEILYHMPDHPGVMQSFVWQELNIAPGFPVLRRFLDAIRIPALLILVRLHRDCQMTTR